jgi:transposase
MSIGHGNKISRKREMAIAALLSHPSIPAAAKSIGISEKSLGRWLRQNEFREAYLAAKRQGIRQALTSIQAAIEEAVQTLRDVMNDSASPPASRVNSAKTIIDFAVKGLELEDFELRLARLEEHLPRATRREE